jgi:DNA primase
MTTLETKEKKPLTDWLKTLLLLLDFQIEQILKKHELDSAGGKLKAVKEIAGLFAELSSPIVRNEYIKTLSERIGVREEDFSAELKILSSKKLNKNRRIEDSLPQRIKRREPEEFIIEAESNLLSLYFLKEDFWSMVSSKLKEVQFKNQNHQLLNTSIGQNIDKCYTIDELIKKLQLVLAENIEAMETLSGIIFSLEDKYCLNNESAIDLFIKENQACIARFKVQNEEQKIKERYYAAKDDEIKALELQYEVRSIINSRLSTL